METELQQKARQARAVLESAIVDALEAHPGGLYNNELARLLDLESDYEGRQSNYLTYSLLGGLLAQQRVRKEKREGRTYYIKAEAA
jgi:hypothetical protein